MALIDFSFSASQNGVGFYLYIFYGSHLLRNPYRGSCGADSLSDPLNSYQGGSNCSMLPTSSPSASCVLQNSHCTRWWAQRLAKRSSGSPLCHLDTGPGPSLFCPQPEGLFDSEKKNRSKNPQSVVAVTSFFVLLTTLCIISLFEFFHHSGIWRSSKCTSLLWESISVNSYLLQTRKEVSMAFFCVTQGLETVYF